MLYDDTRNKFVTKTPEEKVRQAVLNYLISKLKIPKELIKTEFALSSLACGERGRVDIIVADPNEFDLTKPFLLAECKATKISLNSGDKKRFLSLESQVNKYLRILQPKHIILALGAEWRFLSLDAGIYKAAAEISGFLPNR